MAAVRMSTSLVLKQTTSRDTLVVPVTFMPLGGTSESSLAWDIKDLLLLLLLSLLSVVVVVAV